MLHLDLKWKQIRKICKKYYFNYIYLPELKGIMERKEEISLCESLFFRKKKKEKINCLLQLYFILNLIQNLQL